MSKTIRIMVEFIDVPDEVYNENIVDFIHDTMDNADWDFLVDELLDGVLVDMPIVYDYDNKE